MLIKSLGRKVREISLKEFSERRNKVLILRRCGGLGDILMHRMIFEDIHKVIPEMELTFACPFGLFNLAEGHPFIDKLIDCNNIDQSNYGVVYDTTTKCRVHESKYAPAKEHRSDIWAASCGLFLENHKMHIEIKEQDKLDVKNLIGNQPTVLFVPESTGIPEKNLTKLQVEAVVSGLKKRGFKVIGLHTSDQHWADHSIVTTDLKYWKKVIAAVDYVITVDTAAFHFAGGIGKPMVGVFSFTDGKVYGKYYKFILVQKHRDNGNWDCGPCFVYPHCKKESGPCKPCVSELSPIDILEGFDMLISSNEKRAPSFALPILG